jgi:hypothetical protein
VTVSLLQGFTLYYDLSIDDSAGSDFHGVYLTPHFAGDVCCGDDDAKRPRSTAGAGGQSTPVTVSCSARFRLIAEECNLTPLLQREGVPPTPLQP